MDNIHIMIPITITTANMPAKAPALNMPVTTEHPLNAIMARTKNTTFNFLMVLVIRSMF